MRRVRRLGPACALAVLLVIGGAPAWAQAVVRVAPVGDPPPLDPTWEAAANGLDARLAELLDAGVDPRWEVQVLDAAGDLDLGRSLYFEGDSAAAIEVLAPWLPTIEGGTFILALHRDLATRALDAMLTLARAERDVGLDPAETLRRAAALFPAAQPSPDLYPAWLVDAWTAAAERHDQPVRIEAPTECALSVNGIAPAAGWRLVADGPPVWLRWRCGERDSLLYRAVPHGSVTFAPALDGALRQNGSRRWLALASADPRALSDALAALAANVGVDEVVAIETSETGAATIVVGDGTRVVRAARGVADALDAIVECAREGRCANGTTRWSTDGGWDVDTPADPRRAAAWVLLGTGVASAGAGAGLEAALAGAVRRVDACADDVACAAQEGTLADRRRTARTLRGLATGAWALAGAAAGTSALLLATGRDRAGRVALAPGPGAIGLSITVLAGGNQGR